VRRYFTVLEFDINSEWNFPFQTD